MQKQPLALAILIAGILGASSAFGASTLDIPFTPADLAEGKIKGNFDALFVSGQTSASIADKTNKCKLKFTATNTLVWDKADAQDKTPSGCSMLWDSIQEKDFTFEFLSVPSKTNDVTVTFKPVKIAGSLAEPNVDKTQIVSFSQLDVPDAGELYFPVPLGNPNEFRWEKATRSDDTFKIPELLRKTKHVAYANFDDKKNVGTWNTVEIDPTQPTNAGGGTSGGGSLPNPPTPTVTPNYEGFCNVDNPNIEDTKYIVCLDLYEDGDEDALENGSGGAFRFIPETRGHILLPNRAVIVRVRHPRGTRVTISMDGKRGLSKGIIDNRTPEQVKAEAKADGQPVPTQIYSDVISEVSFGPRLPGESDIKVVLERAEGNEKKTSTYRTEVTVEELYIGAFRLGLGPVFQGAVERSYAAEVMPGSQQAQIVAKTSGTTDLELVLGFAPYLLDYYQRGGRASISRRTSYIAPYVGLGLVNAKENSLELLKSLHLGVELELSPGFSFATTFVMRRVTRLADGYHVGMPVNAPDVPTTTGYNWGWGLVANFSPEFFKVATTSSTKFFK